MALIGFCGSRSLRGREAACLVSPVVQSVVRAGSRIAVGCAVGPDRLALDSALAAGACPLVFAAFGPDGTGAWQGSAVTSVRAAAGVPGVNIRWWAGGNQAVPLVKRLTRRTLAMVEAGGATSGDRRSIVAFLGPGWSAGTLLTVQEAIRWEVTVVVFPVGGAKLPSPKFGKWVRAGNGVWASGFKWVRA